MALALLWTWFFNDNHKVESIFTEEKRRETIQMNVSYFAKKNSFFALGRKKDIIISDNPD